ncbi:MAG: Aminopeptidase N [Bacteroidetes bacterium ADurb.Bin234]|nr:MAG: Aminopeptidase N [Bacteroidetes bacterium ADurb.Bin234]
MHKQIFLFFLLLYSYNLCSQCRTDSAHIAHYDINLSIIDFNNKQIQGFTEIKAVSKINHLNHINLDFAAFNIDSITISDVVTSLYTHSNETLNIQLPDNKSGDTISIRIYYQGTPYVDDYFGGFYFSSDYAFNIGCGFVSVPHNLGRAWFPCFDEYWDKSTYTFNIRTEKHKTAVCGGLLKDSLYLPDSTRLWIWELNSPIPSYLASVAVGEYLAFKDTFQGLSSTLPIEIYVPPTYLPLVEETFRLLKPVLRNFENKFGAYSWKRVGYIGVPFNKGAMEHSCNIAYPFFAINGNDMYMLLYAHELAHSWFGNLITCATAEEMWINEGFASYCEAITMEKLFPNSDPELDGYKSHMRDLHRYVLQNTHLKDEGYYALNKVPLEFTFGSTSYDKGSLVVHTLRHQLGDSLFFSGMKSLLNHFAFSTLNSETLFSYLSQNIGVDLTYFYNAWVNQPGFLDFLIDSIHSTDISQQYKVYLQQRLHQAQYYGNNVKLDLTFFSDDGQTYTETISCSGSYDSATVSIPFSPLFGVVDFYEKLSDACIDYNINISSIDGYQAPEANMSVEVDNVFDTAFIRIENHLVAPDTLKNDNPDIYRISDSHFWRIAYYPHAALEGSFYFNYEAYENNLDYNLVQGYTKDDIILLYRQDASKDWKIIQSTQRGTVATGSLQTTKILAGEYCLAIGNKENISIPAMEGINNYSIYPNPTSDYVDLLTDDLNLEIHLFDADGKLLLSSPILSKSTRISLKDYAKGIYIIKIVKDKQTVKYFKVVKI